MPSTFTVVPGDESPLGRARLALEGLSVGDAFGERFFGDPALALSRVARREIPRSPWFWTDDTAMALSIFEILRERGAIDEDLLARRFAERYARDPVRGYGGTAHTILSEIAQGAPWQAVAREAFGGQGSMGNGGAMRAAPVGAYFADDLDRVVIGARASAAPTHAHPDGQSGAIAVAVATALAWQGRRESWHSDRAESFLRAIAELTPAGPTQDGLRKAAALPTSSSVGKAVAALGNGSRVISSDTVPFALWCAAHHLDDFQEALWTTVSGLGDRDTTCAIVGGIVAARTGYDGIPASFVSAREPLDSMLNHVERHAVKTEGP
jgi:ADP-ribosylglycohydrolase